MNHITALIIDCAGLASDVTILADENGGHLGGMYRALGCNLVDVVQLTARLDMWIDDEGILTEQPLNGSASYIALRYGFTWQYYHGTVLFAGGPDENGEMTSLNPDTATALKGMVIEFISLMWSGGAPTL